MAMTREVRTPRCVGRGTALADLTRALAEPPALALVECEAGIGKSRLYGSSWPPRPVGRSRHCWRSARRCGTRWRWARSRTRSGPPAEAADQLGYLCFGRDYLQRHDGPCGPVPAVFVSYDLGDRLAMDNTVVAPGGAVARRPRVPPSLPVPDAGDRRTAALDLLGPAGVDTGAVRPAGDGRFEVRLTHPPARHRGSDQVSLRVEAWDVAGNRVAQGTRDAFTLADRMPAGAH
ncbi:MAG: hypothetical protein ACRDT2_12945 [Natronosporangium sp.]